MSKTVGTGARGVETTERKKKRQFNKIVFKRNHILWSVIIKDKVFGKQLSPEEAELDTYGHFWVEIGDESYGWWPEKEVGFLDTIKGVDGFLNSFKKGARTPGVPNSQDWHHGDIPHEEFVMIVSKEDIRTPDDIMNFIRNYSKPFKAGWSYPARPQKFHNCQSFQKRMIRKCEFYQKGAIKYYDLDGNEKKQISTPPNVEEID